MVEIKNLVKRYGDLLALDHLNLQVREGGGIRPAGAKRLRQDHGHQLYAGAFEV